MFGWFSKGTITIQPSKFNYSSGELIEGSITIKLKKPLMGKEVTIRLFGEEKLTRIRNGQRRTETKKIYDFKQPLAGEGNYPANQPMTYTFQIKIPDNIIQNPKLPGGFMGGLLKISQMFSGPVYSKTMWYLKARLNVKGFDITKKIQINVANNISGSSLNL